MPNFILQPGGVAYLLASQISTPNGQPAQNTSGKNKTTGRIRLEPGTVLSAPSKHYFGGAQDRWKQTSSKPDFIVNSEIRAILEKEEMAQSETEDSMPSFSLPSKPFMFPTEDGLYDVFRAPKEKVNDVPLELDEAQSLLSGLLKDKEEKPVVRRTAKKIGRARTK